jgi:hypothetical protein
MSQKRGKSCSQLTNLQGIRHGFEHCLDVTWGNPWVDLGNPPGWGKPPYGRSANNVNPQDIESFLIAQSYNIWLFNIAMANNHV